MAALHFVERLVVVLRQFPAPLGGDLVHLLVHELAACFWIRDVNRVLFSITLNLERGRLGLDLGLQSAQSGQLIGKLRINSETIVPLSALGFSNTAGRHGITDFVSDARGAFIDE